MVLLQQPAVFELLQKRMDGCAIISVEGGVSLRGEGPCEILQVFIVKVVIDVLQQVVYILLFLG